MAKGAQTDLDDLGIAKNAREEKTLERRRQRANDEDARKNAEMALLYRQHVLKEPVVPVLQIQGLTKSRATAAAPSEAVH